jgi:hypothetical protein
MSEWNIPGRKEHNRTVAPEAFFTSEASDVARVYVVPTEDGRYALSPGSCFGTADHRQDPADAVVRVSGPALGLARLVRDHSLRLYGLDAVRLLERVSRCGLEVAWLENSNLMPLKIG